MLRSPDFSLLSNAMSATVVSSKHRTTVVSTRAIFMLVQLLGKLYF